MKKIKVLDLKVGIETNGLNPNFIKYLIDNELVDYFAMDIKAPLEEEKYAQIVGKKISLKKIKESIKLIRQTKDYEFRTTLVPNFLNEEDVFKIAEEIKGAKRYFLQIYRNAEGREIYPENFDFKNLKEKLKNYFEVFSLRC
jgi:pyruvate formate lyase activating enzyme